MASTRPRARKEGLVVREVGSEVLVYDLQRHKASCLNRSAALVWRHCDGETSMSEMTALLRADLARPLEEPFVRLALQRLHEAHLLEAAPAAEVRRYSRREWAARSARLGLSAALLPAVVSILAPTTAEAALTAISMMACTALTPPCPGVSCVNAMGVNQGPCVINAAMTMCTC